MLLVTKLMSGFLGPNSFLGGFFKISKVLVTTGAGGSNSGPGSSTGASTEAREGGRSPLLTLLTFFLTEKIINDTVKIIYDDNACNPCLSNLN